MAFVKLVGILLIVMAIACLVVGNEQFENGKRMERIMENSEKTGIGDGYSFYGKSYVSMSEQFNSLANINAIVIGLIGCSFIAIDNSISQLKRKDI